MTGCALHLLGKQALLSDDGTGMGPKALWVCFPLEAKEENIARRCLQFIGANMIPEKDYASPLIPDIIPSLRLLFHRYAYGLFIHPGNKADRQASIMGYSMLTFQKGSIYHPRLFDKHPHISSFFLPRDCFMSVVHLIVTRITVFSTAHSSIERFTHAPKFRNACRHVTKSGNLCWRQLISYDGVRLRRKPVIGCRVYVTKSTGIEFRILPLLGTMIYWQGVPSGSPCLQGLSGGFHYKPRVGKPYLHQHEKGLIALSALRLR